MLVLDGRCQARLSRYRNTLHAILRDRRLCKADREEFLREFETAARSRNWARAQHVLSLAVELSRGFVSDEVDLADGDLEMIAATRTE